MRTLVVNPLTPEAFKPFGDVLDVASASTVREINAGNTARFHDLADIYCTDQSGKVSINIFRSNCCELPFFVKEMECHPKASQLFMPLGDNPYLVIVAPPGEFSKDKLEAFLATSDQGVNYHAGTWHHFSLALDQQSDFLVVDYADVEDNCEFVSLSEQVMITRGGAQWMI